MKIINRAVQIGIIIAAIFILIYPNTSTKTKADLAQLRVETKISDVPISDIEDDLLKVINLIYSPMTEKDMNIALEILGKYSTKSMLESFKNGTNKFKNSGNRLSNIKISIGSPKNQLDNTYKFMITFNIENSGYSKNMAVEFIFTEVGNLVGYDVWYLEAFS